MAKRKTQDYSTSPMRQRSLADRQRRIDALVAESKHGGQESKRVLAEIVADLRSELDRIIDKRDAGTAHADEIRIMPGLAGQITKAMLQLGLSLEFKADGKPVNLKDDDGDAI